MRWSRWSSRAGCVACRTATSRPPWPRSSALRPRCRSRPSAGSARRSVRSSPPGGPGICPGCGWSTCSWTPATCKLHPGAPAEPVLAAWGIDVDGKPVFVGLAPAASESTDAWDDFLADLTERGLRAPLLGISDGAPGLTGAFDRVFPASLGQRCLVHRARTTLAKVSAHAQAEVKADFWAIFDVGDAEPGEEAVAVAHRQAAEFAAKWQRRYPAAVACVTDDPASLTVHLRFPAEHWHRIRHSNFIERTFGETRRRTRSSAGSPASVPACRWCGRCWTG